MFVACITRCDLNDGAPPSTFITGARVCSPSTRRRRRRRLRKHSTKHTEHNEPTDVTLGGPEHKPPRRRRRRRRGRTDGRHCCGPNTTCAAGVDVEWKVCEKQKGLMPRLEGVCFLDAATTRASRARFGNWRCSRVSKKSYDKTVRENDQCARRQPRTIIIYAVSLYTQHAIYI